LFISFSSFGLYAAPDRPDIFVKGDYLSGINYIQEFADYHREENEIPGLSYALINGDEIIWQGGLGVSDKSKGTKANEFTQYRAGALSTLITATLVLQLEHEGKLKLDDPVSKYFPESQFSHRNKSTTIKHLLTHHAGLPLSYFKGMWSETPPTLKETASIIAKSPLSYPADKIFAYSNLGYDLLGRIIEIVTNEKFQHVAEEKLFTRLGMDRSSFYWDKLDKDNLSQGYKDGDLKPFLATRDIPALGLVSNVIDLAAFAQATMNLLPKAKGVMPVNSWEKMIERHNQHVKLDLNKGIGLGWQIGGMETKYHKPIVWRQGATLLHRSRIAMIPELGLGIVIMANSSKGFRALDTISNEALDVLLEIKLGKLEEKEAELNAGFPGELTNFKNLYSTFIGLLKSNKEDDSYVLDVMGWEVVLKPVIDGWYRLEYDLLGFIPLKLDWFAKIRVAAARLDGVDVAILQHKGVNYLFGMAVEQTAFSKKWQKRIGVYGPKERDALLDHYDIQEGELKLYEGVLVFEYELPAFLPLKLRLPLMPISDDEAIVPGLGTGLGERVSVVRDEQGEYFLYSGYKLVAKPENSFFSF